MMIVINVTESDAVHYRMFLVNTHIHTPNTHLSPTFGVASLRL